MKPGNSRSVPYSEGNNLGAFPGVVSSSHDHDGRAPQSPGAPGVVVRMRHDDADDDDDDDGP